MKYTHAKLNLLFSIILLLIVLTINATAQVSSNTAFRIRRGTSTPATCTEGDVFFVNGSATAYLCGPNNTWVAFASGSGFVTGSGTTKQVAYFTGATSVLGAAGFEYQSGATPNVLLTSQADNHRALQVAPFSNNYSTAPFQVRNTTNTIAFNVDPLSNVSDTVYIDGTGSNASVGYAAYTSGGGANELAYFSLSSSGGFVTYRSIGSGGPGTSLAEVANSGNFQSTGAGGLYIVASNAAGPLIFGTGGAAAANERARITPAGVFRLGLPSTTTGALQFSSAGSANTQSLTIGSPAATNSFVWPTADPTASQVLTASAPSAGVVTLTWAAAGATPAGSGSELQARLNASAFQAVTGSSISGANVILGGTLSVPGSGGSSLRLGASATAGGSQGVAVGVSASAGGTNSTAIGQGATDQSNDNCTALGKAAKCTAANQLVIGSDSAPFSNAYFGGDRQTASPTNVTLNAGGGNGTNVNGAQLGIAGGQATGNAASGSVKLKTSVVAASSNTLQTLVDRYIVNGTRKTLTDASTNLFEIALPTLKGAMGEISYEIFATDGTDLQVRRGLIQYSAVNKAGAYTTEIVIVNEGVSASTGTLTATFAITAGTDKVTISTTPVGSLTETIYYIIYTITNNSEQAITIL